MLTEQGLLARQQIRNDFATKVTVTTGSAYASGNTVGGQMTLDSSNGVTGPNDEQNLSSILQSIAVLDPSSQSPALDLFFFNAPVAGTITDKVAFAPTLADLENCIGIVSVATADYKSGGTNGTVASGVNQANLGKVLKPGVAKSTAIYCVPVARGTPTFTSAQLYFRFQFSQGL